MKLFVLISGLLLTSVAVASESKEQIIECKRIVVIQKNMIKKVISAHPNVIRCQPKKSHR
jgi:hypothetical protein